MSMFTDGYQTTVGSMFVTKNIETAIKESIIKDGLDNVNLGVSNNGKVKPIFITGSYNSESEIPLFTHPITIFNFRGNDYLCTDLRLFVKKDSPVHEIEKNIKNRTEYNLAKSRAVLNLIWLNEGTSGMRIALSFAGSVFSTWLSEAISRTFALDFKDQTTISVITDFYYQTLFSDDKVFDEDFKQKAAIHTIKATNSTSALVFEIFDQIEVMSSIEDYCEYVKKITENVRLKDFNLAVLLTIVKNSWYGANAKEMLSVALEHPPTWNAIVYTALTEKTYRTSNIYKIAERLGKRGVSDEYLKHYVAMVTEHVSIANEEAIVFRDYE